MRFHFSGYFRHYRLVFLRSISNRTLFHVFVALFRDIFITLLIIVDVFMKKNKKKSTSTCEVSKREDPIRIYFRIVNYDKINVITSNYFVEVVNYTRNGK